MFNYTFDTKVTRELLLQKNNEETYMSHYLGIPVKKGLFKSSLRDDKHTTCAFFRGKSGVLYFKDFATGDCLDFVNVVMKKYAVSYHKAIEIIAKDFGVISGKLSMPIKIQPAFKEENRAVIQCEVKDFTDAELRWWGNFGITPKILNKFKIFSCKTIFLNGNIFAVSAQHCPIYGYYFGKKENIEQWKIYMPNNKDKGIRFLGNCSQKMMQGYHQLPKRGKVCVITKSLKDCAALYAYGIPACAPHSENIIPSESIVNDLLSRFERVFAFWDNDMPGVTFLNKIKKKYPQLKPILIPRKYGVKDFSDLRKKFGHEKTGKLIKEYLESLK